MFLIVSSTRLELDAIMPLVEGDNAYKCMLSGVGSVETAINLAGYLAKSSTDDVSGVINVGIAGAYPRGGAELLDICLADHEFFGDTGICYPNRIDPLDPSFAPPVEFELDNNLLKSAEVYMTKGSMHFRRGPFVTVSSASGTKERGDYLQGKFNALCENMEGATVASVCKKMSLPCLEIRTVSNMVVDRNDQVWHIEESLNKLRNALEIILPGLIND